MNSHIYNIWKAHQFCKAILQYAVISTSQQLGNWNQYVEHFSPFCSILTAWCCPKFPNEAHQPIPRHSLSNQQCPQFSPSAVLVLTAPLYLIVLIINYTPGYFSHTLASFMLLALPTPQTLCWYKQFELFKGIPNVHVYNVSTLSFLSSSLPHYNLIFLSLYRKQKCMADWIPYVLQCIFRLTSLASWRSPRRHDAVDGYLDACTHILQCTYSSLQHTWFHIALEYIRECS